MLGGIEKALIELIQNWYLTTGYAGIVFAMALESCCIPLPSEIVMPLAGYFVYYGSQHADKPQFNLLLVALSGALGCVLGSAVAYWIGFSGGRPLLLRYGKYILISQADSDRADRWFQRHGASVAFFSRLLPVIRTYISLPAGIYEMNFWQFIGFTFLGSLPWSLGLAYVGYLLGSVVGNNPTEIPDKLGGIFHGLDIAIILALAAAVFFYVRRHLKHDRDARAAGAIDEPRMPIRR